MALMLARQRNSKWNWVNYYGYGDGEIEVGKFQIHQNPETKEFSVWAVEIYAPYRGLGHGRDLMHQVMQVLKEIGATRATLFVDLSNTVAVKLYESLGWKREAEWQDRGVIRMEVSIQ